MRVSSLTNLGVAIERDIPSGYDEIQDVAAIDEEVVIVANNIDSVVSVAIDLPDILTVQAAADLVENLSVSATTLGDGTEATAVLTGSNIAFGIPEGKDGADGQVPDIEFSVDVDGNLQYEVVGYYENATQEW
jgi:hypothetical protein